MCIHFISSLECLDYIHLRRRVTNPVRRTTDIDEHLLRQNAHRNRFYLAPVWLPTTYIQKLENRISQKDNTRGQTTVVTTRFLHDKLAFFSGQLSLLIFHP